MNTMLDPRKVAATFGVTTLDLAGFLREKAAELMKQAVPIARNEPWYSHEDAVAQFGELDDLTERAKRLMQAAFECDRCYYEDHPLEDEGDLPAAKGTD